VALLPQHVNKSNFNKASGLTILEVMVSLLLLGILALIASGLVIPLRVNRDSGRETQALTYGRSYIELVKSLWLEPNKYTAITLPVVTGASPDIKLPTGWTITPAINRFTTPTTELPQFSNTAVPAMRVYSDTLREVVVTVTAPDNKTTILRTVIARP
jgi:prepilin-type N-terminal cleavage/methylation domain-containing protein